LPNTWRFINRHNIPIHSAYELDGHNDISMWKYLTLLNLVKTQPIKSLVSIGDSEFERSATIKLQVDKTHIEFRTIKMFNKPTFHQLVSQHNKIQQLLPHLSTLDNNHINLVPPTSL